MVMFSAFYNFIDFDEIEEDESKPNSIGTPSDPSNISKNQNDSSLSQGNLLPLFMFIY